MPFSFYKTKGIRLIFLLYWILLVYIIAALVWWFIALNRQNQQMAKYEISRLNKDDPAYEQGLGMISSFEKRKSAQYLGEGAIFLLLILAGAVYIFRAVRQQFRSAHQQQNFMMAVTHELKTPIAITKLNLETLQKRKLENNQQQRLITNTIQEANRLNALCNNMLLASQMESGASTFNPEEVNLSELVIACIGDFTDRFPQRNIVGKVNEGIYINADLFLLQMAINNLIDNAIKYSPKNTDITITLTPNEKQVSLMVADEGSGIAAADKRKIFDKFYRIGNKATREAKGTGLGLYLTKKIARQHHAKLFVMDNEPAGSNFTMIFTVDNNRLA